METAWPLTRIDVGLSPHIFDVMVTSQVLSSYETREEGKGKGRVQVSKKKFHTHIRLD